MFGVSDACVILEKAVAMKDTFILFAVLKRNIDGFLVEP